MSYLDDRDHVAMSGCRRIGIPQAMSLRRRWASSPVDRDPPWQGAWGLVTFLSKAGGSWSPRRARSTGRERARLEPVAAARDTHAPSHLLFLFPSFECVPPRRPQNQRGVKSSARAAPRSDRECQGESVQVCSRNNRTTSHRPMPWSGPTPPVYHRAICVGRRRVLLPRTAIAAHGSR